MRAGKLTDDPIDPLHRLVLDEASLDFSQHDDPVLQESISQLVDLLFELSTGGHSVAKWSDVYEFECRDGFALHDLLFDSVRSPLDRDERVRLASILSRLPCWDDDFVAVPLSPQVEGRHDVALAPSIGYALIAATRRLGVACVTTTLVPAGYFTVSDRCGSASLFFFSSGQRLPRFWRANMALEQIREVQFFDRCTEAFPDLAFSSDLSFSRFAGSYTGLRDRVVEILGVLNDQFMRIWQERQGQPREVEVELRSFNVVATRESVKTRASAKHMSMRDIVHDGNTYRCEWHAKLEPHRNRIHFAVPSVQSGDPILIGIFVDHLPTP